jgi:anti-anti-sigma factor
VIPTTAVLAVTGEIDIAREPALRLAVAAALASGAPEVRIDLSATTFMDTAGLHLLLEAAQQARDQRRRLAIVCPRGDVRRVLELTGVEELLPLSDDVAVLSAPHTS